jgi:hypothetical protein
LTQIGPNSPRPCWAASVEPALGFGAAGESAQAGGQLVVGEGLDEVVVGTRIEPDNAVVDRVSGGQHEDRQIAPFAADAAGDLEARDVGQADVEDDDIDAVLAQGDVDTGLAIGRDLDVVAVLFEKAGERSAQALVVLDEEDLHCGDWFLERSTPVVRDDRARSEWEVPAASRRRRRETTRGRDRGGRSRQPLRDA